ncbi:MULTISPECIES: CmlA/FloR family chloramphenicol efflux MFS transporter [Gammaproteobacteria]|uniref:Bcr/CflA family efflux transporter n=2 Tax=Pseudomonas TaxID=286 RepID=A0A7W2Q8N3_9PSED|nr:MULTISPECIES: CmlA/FloR family chloramphenicol efflux MFS transporter [Gammaproteobacteria]MBA6097378.1 CmlA/FloR family chloramphenicol efflux MFS transporter [Pseudomonas juntendi]MBA6115732.1 CmlA/FloR family chloramphenicol efflux MFS transporter [Pseudomonas putida]
MSDKNLPAWAYSLPSTLMLMVPFDILASLAMDVYLPVVPQMPSELSATTALIQLTLSSYILVIGLGQLIFGPLSDRIGRRSVVLGGATLFAIASFALAATSNGAVFLAFRILQALGASAALVGTFATVRDVYADKPEGATIYGLFGSILAFVPALGPILGAIVALAFGWRAIFAMLGVMAVLALLHAWFRWRETCPSNGQRRSPAISSILSNRPFWVYTIGFSTAMGAFFVFFSISPMVLIDGAGWGPASFSLSFASVALVMIITTRFIGKVVKKWDVSGCFARGALTMAAGAVVLAALSISMRPGFISFVMPMWLIAIGIVLMVSVTANGALRDFGDVAGTAVAMYYCIQSLIVSGLGTLAVLVLDGSTAWPLVAYVLAMCAASMVGYAALKQK